MKGTARVVIIGGGVIGCSVAYHLTRLGLRDVVLLERAELTSGSTWHAAGLNHLYAETPFLSRIYKESFDTYRGLEAETGSPTGVHVTGGVRLARTRDAVDEFKRYLAPAHALGIDAEIVGPNRVRELWPLLESRDFLAGLHTPGEGYVDPTQTTNALAKAARDRGAEINRYTRVTGLRRTPTGEWRVETDKGVIIAEIVVNAAGCWGAEISAMLGHYLPVLSMAHQYLVTEQSAALSGLTAELPVLRDYSVPFYCRQERQGLMFSGYEHDAALTWLDGAPADFANELFPPDLERSAPVLEETYRMIPALQTLGIRTVVHGAIPGTPDMQGLLGPAHGLHNYFVCCGIHGGFVQGGLTRYLAEWIVEGEPSIDISPVDVRRFGRYATKEYAVSAISANYMWSVPANYPETEPTGGRRARMTPLHAALRAEGAVFGVANGWEVPNWFAPAGVEREDRPSFGRANWFDHVGAECAAVDKAAGIFDMSALAKFEITGAGAEAFLDRLSAHRLPAVGKRRRSAWLSPSGSVAFWVTIDRLAADHFFLTAPAVAEQRLEDRLRDHEPGGAVQIVNQTATTGALLIAGPAAGDILQAATLAVGTDRSPTGIAVDEVLATAIGMAPVRLVRVDDVAESAWEVYCAAEYVLGVYERLVEQGRGRGLKNCGRRAYDSRRLERGIPRWGIDFGIETSAEAAGIALDDGRSPAGERTFTARRKAARLVRLHVDDRCPTTPWGGEVVEAAGKPVGSITSGAYGHMTGKHLAFALVSPELAAPGSKLDVVVLGERYAAQVMPPHGGETGARR
jgi:dimethylglycine dehydrogenase